MKVNYFEAVSAFVEYDVHALGANIFSIIQDATYEKLWCESE